MDIERENLLVLGGFDSVEFVDDDELVDLINILKKLNDSEYQFVMTNTLRLRGRSQ